VYAEVAVPVHVASTFIYRIPVRCVTLRKTVRESSFRLGENLSRIIVALLDQLRRHQSPGVGTLRKQEEILDVIPLVTPELLKLTRWVAEYYLARGEVIRRRCLQGSVLPSTSSSRLLKTAGLRAAN